MFLDTHVVVMLHAGSVEKVSQKAIYFLNTEELLISPASVLELQWYHESGMIRYPADKVVQDLQDLVDLKVLDRSWLAVMALALDLTWASDPFDRMIVAHASLYKEKLLTMDRTIRDNYKDAFWD